MTTYMSPPGSVPAVPAVPPPLAARRILDLAAQVEAHEAQIKQAIVMAAQAGACEIIITIMNRWNTKPTAEVLAGIHLPSSPESR